MLNLIGIPWSKRKRNSQFEHFPSNRYYDCYERRRSILPYEFCLSKNFITLSSWIISLSLFSHNSAIKTREKLNSSQWLHTYSYFSHFINFLTVSLQLNAGDRIRVFLCSGKSWVRWLEYDARVLPLELLCSIDF